MAISPSEGACMISSLTGEIQHITADSAVIAVGGVGYHFSASPNTLTMLRTGQVATIQTRLLIRDDNPVLYGFSTADEREIFDVMMSVSGIGPRIALAVLSVFNPDEVRQYIDQQDDKAFTKDRKSTRLNSSHVSISYAVFCLKKKRHND